MCAKPPLRNTDSGVKLRIGPMIGFKRFKTAAITIAGIELSRRIQKGQFNLAGRHLDARNVAAVWSAALTA